MKIPLVLVPGLLSNEILWEHQIAHLKKLAEIQVIVAHQNTPQKMVQFILEQAPPQFALAGHSMGGWLCLEVMRHAKERVKKLCLLNTTARSDSEEKKQWRQKMVSEVEQGQFPTVVKGLADRLVYTPHVKQHVEKMFLSVGQEVFIHQETAMLARNECFSILPRIKCPTLIIHASQDKLFSSEEQTELVEHIPQAKLAIVEDSGHMSPMEVPQAVTALLRFWMTYF